MKSERRRNIFDGRRGRGRSEDQSEHGAADQGTAVCNRGFVWSAIANRCSLKSPIRHSAEAASAESAATLRVRADWVNCSLWLSRAPVLTIPNAIFRQEFFDSRTKIKFRFFLVGFARGF
jgi:hypothetical protein